MPKWVSNMPDYCLQCIDRSMGRLMVRSLEATGGDRGDHDLSDDIERLPTPQKPPEGCK
jgi:hypothetical protein